MENILNKTSDPQLSEYNAGTRLWGEIRLSRRRTPSDSAPGRLHNIGLNNYHSFYRAEVYKIYILLIYPGRLKGNFQYTPALEKEWQNTASSRDQLENMPPWAICTPPLGSVLLQAVQISICAFLNQCVSQSVHFSICAILNLCISQSVFFSIHVFLNLCFSQSVFFSICVFLNLCDSQSVQPPPGLVEVLKLKTGVIQWSPEYSIELFIPKYEENYSKFQNMALEPS